MRRGLARRRPERAGKVALQVRVRDELGGELSIA